jgi:hypothetical protein
MGCGHLPSDFHRLVGKSGVSHLASIVLARDTSGHSLAFLAVFRVGNLPHRSEVPGGGFVDSQRGHLMTSPSQPCVSF